jgi:tetratricopeptide (TPR) repeat protein
VKIDKLVERVKSNPMDTLATQELLNQISTLPKSRCVKSSDAMTTIANAQAAVGLYDAAKVTIQKAVDLNPKSDKVEQSRQEIDEQWENHRRFQDKVEILKENIDRLNANPKNTKLRDTLAINLEELKRVNPSTHASQSDVLAVGMATAIVGQYRSAEEVADNVLRVSPNQPEAKRLKEDIRDNKIKQRFPPKREPQKPSARPESPKPVPNGRVSNGNENKPPVVASPVSVKLDTIWQSKLIPKSTLIAKEFVKWDKEQ